MIVRIYAGMRDTSLRFRTHIGLLDICLFALATVTPYFGLGVSCKRTLSTGDIQNVLS